MDQQRRRQDRAFGRACARHVTGISGRDQLDFRLRRCGSFSCHSAHRTEPEFSKSEFGNSDLANRQLLGVCWWAARASADRVAKADSLHCDAGCGMGILAAVLASCVCRSRHAPVVSLAEAARRVAAGDLGAKVDVESSDELGELAASFNRMTEDLAQQKTALCNRARGRVARTGPAFGARIENPLFPLQVTVENLMRPNRNRRRCSRKCFTRELQPCWRKSTT